MDVHKLVLEAYRKKFLSKEQLTEIQQFKAKNSSPDALSEMIVKRGFLTQEQWKQLQPPSRSNTIQICLKAKNTPQILALEEFQQCLDFFFGGPTQTASFLETFFANRYKIKSLLGEGGMGTVYQAEDQRLQRIVALKLIKFGHQTPEAQKRFFNESRAIAKLEHPNIVRIYEVDADPQPYFTMEYVPGETLSSLLQKQGHSLSSKESAHFARSLAQALDYIHEKNIFHLDIKPSNVILSTSGEPKLMDFGLAQEIEHKLSKMSRIAGTPSYISPEQILGLAAKINQQTDVYLLGGTLYEMLTGAPPFSGGSVNHIYYQVLSSEPVRPKLLNPLIHADLEAICLKALEKDQVRRYVSAKEMLQDLDNFLEHRPVMALRPTRWMYLKKWLWRNKGLSFLGSALVLFFCFLWLYFQYQERKTFQQHLNQAKELRDLGESEEKLEEKMKHFLQGMYAIDTALLMSPKDFRVANIKLKLSQSLIDCACASKNFQFASYFVREIERLETVEDAEKTKLREKVEGARTETLREHQKRLQYWKLHLRNPLAGMREEALLEISKMAEIEILEELAEELKKGTIYFLTSRERTSKQDEYYEMMVVALGSLENPKAGAILWEYIEKISQKLLRFQEGNRPDADIQYMATQVQALSNSKALGFSEKLRALRWKMGEGSLFWNKTEMSFGKLVLRDRFIDKLQPSSAQDFFDRALVKAEIKDFKGALLDFSEAIHRNPQLAEAYTNRGNARRMQGDLEGSILDYSEAIRLNPQDFKSYNNRGLSKKIKGDLEGALLDFSEAIHLNSKYAEAYNHRGSAKQEKRDLEGALLDFSQAITINPQYIGAYNNRGHTKRAKKDLEGAILDFSEAIRLNPQDSRTYTNRGVSKHAKGDLDGAISDYSEAIRLSPQESKSYYNRGVAKKTKKDLEGAISDFTEVIRLNPQDPDAYYSRGITKKEKGDFHGAVEDLEQRLKLKAHPEANRILIDLLKQQSRECWLKKDWEGAKQSLFKLKQYLPREDPQQKQMDQKIKELEELLQSQKK